jgi:hypothetical protein
MNENALSITNNPDFNKNMAGLPLAQYHAVAALFDAQIAQTRTATINGVLDALHTDLPYPTEACTVVRVFAKQPAAPVEDKIGSTDHVGRDLDDMPQPFAGAIVLLETIAECGARPYIGDDPTPIRDDCNRFAKELRVAGRAASAQGPKVDYAQLTDALDLPDLSGPLEHRVWQLARLLRGLRADKSSQKHDAHSRHSIEGVVKFKRHSDHKNNNNSDCICCPDGDHIFSRSVQWDAYQTNRPEHFGNGPEVFVSSCVTDHNLNEGRRVRLTVEVLGARDGCEAGTDGQNTV